MSTVAATTDNESTNKTSFAPAIFVVVMCLLFTIGAIFFKYMDSYGRYSAEPKPAALQELEKSLPQDNQEQ